MMFTIRADVQADSRPVETVFVSMRSRKDRGGIPSSSRFGASHRSA